MLILSRKKNESIILTLGGVRVEITIVELRGDKARVGVTAPDDVTVHRAEIQAIVDREAAERRADAIRRANGNNRDGGIEP